MWNKMALQFECQANLILDLKVIRDLRLLLRNEIHLSET